MDTDIRLYPKSEITFEGSTIVVHCYNNWKCFLSEEIHNGEHARVYLYTVITPSGDIIKNVDLHTANTVIFSEYNWEHRFDCKRQRVRKRSAK
jgi:hypothetical protein